MEKFSEYFTREEFKCKCGNCNQDTIDHELVTILDRLRGHYGSPVKITSGNRCPAHNKSIGGSPTSQHLLSKAADIQMSSNSPEDIYSLLDSWYPDQYGLIIYDDWVHFDVRGYKYRDDKRTK